MENGPSDDILQLLDKKGWPSRCYSSFLRLGHAMAGFREFHYYAYVPLLSSRRRASKPPAPYHSVVGDLKPTPFPGVSLQAHIYGTM